MVYKVRKRQFEKQVVKIDDKVAVGIAKTKQEAIDKAINQIL